MWGGRDVRFFRPEAARLRDRRGAGTCGTEWGVGGRGTAGRNGRSANSGGPRVRARGASRQTGPTRVWRTPLRTHVRGAHVRTHSHERRRLVRTHRGRAATANPPGGGGRSSRGEEWGGGRRRRALRYRRNISGRTDPGEVRVRRVAAAAPSPACPLRAPPQRTHTHARTRLDRRDGRSRFCKLYCIINTRRVFHTIMRIF